MRADYVGCMKTGPIQTDPQWKWHEPQHEVLGSSSYFTHAWGSLYILSGRVAGYLSQLPPGMLRFFANEGGTPADWARSSAQAWLRHARSLRWQLMKQRRCCADVTVGSWMLALNVTHLDDRRLCEVRRLVACNLWLALSCPMLSLHACSASAACLELSDGQQGMSLLCVCSPTAPQPLWQSTTTPPAPGCATQRRPCARCMLTPHALLWRWTLPPSSCPRSSRFSASCTTGSGSRAASLCHCAVRVASRAQASACQLRVSMRLHERCSDV